MSGMSEDLKKIFLLGVGAVAKSSEKASELIDELIQKGSLTVEQGKLLNEELKHNIQKKVDDIDKNINKEIIEHIREMQDLTEEDIKILKKKVEEFEKKHKEK